MSDKEALKNFEKNFEADAELDRKKKEVDAKEAILKEQRINLQFDKFTQAKDDAEKAKTIDLGQSSDAYIKNLVQENDDYMLAARHPLMFINEEFDGVVPFFRKNLILVGGKTGEGKSTTVANIIHSTIVQKHPITGKVPRVLVLTNEEKAEDVYNRTTCLIKGWQYTNHNEFTDEQRKTFREFIPILAKGGRLTVIDDSYEGIDQMTTSVEGLKLIFDNLIAKKEYYDVVIIDYYQNFKYSKTDPTINEYMVQQQVAALLDRYKNIYPAPIVVLSQVNPPDEDNTVPFEIRIKGRKVIMDKATLVLEMVADRENLRTEWICHKSRFTGAVGKKFFTGFKYGKFVNDDNAFKQYLADHKHRKMMREMDKNCAIKPENKEEQNGTSNSDTSGTSTESGGNSQT